MRVSIRQALHPFIKAKAEELGIGDNAEIVNYLLLQLIEINKDAIADNVPETDNSFEDDLSGLLA
ncbi:MAG: hypothetical protein HC815_04085 [Richelia sp. RM1_1_1]|nr:hypothetical protein [Richelia sp. RM1_1_1]